MKPFIQLDETFIAITSIRTVTYDHAKGSTTVEFLDGTKREYRSDTGEMIEDLDCVVIAADPAWKLATFEGGKVQYQTIIAFALETHGLCLPRTITPVDLNYSAMVDPSTGRFVNGVDRSYDDEAAFVAAMTKQQREDELMAQTEKEKSVRH